MGFKHLAADIHIRQWLPVDSSHGQIVTAHYHVSIWLSCLT